IVLTIYAIRTSAVSCPYLKHLTVRYLVNLSFGFSVQTLPSGVKFRHEQRRMGCIDYRIFIKRVKYYSDLNGEARFQNSRNKHFSRHPRKIYIQNRIPDACGNNSKINRYGWDVKSS
ncbi:hypothetical protein L9F63_027209, partial [Diploptera punctata]